jgi:hypothetical protein
MAITIDGDILISISNKITNEKKGMRIYLCFNGKTILIMEPNTSSTGPKYKTEYKW